VKAAVLRCRLCEREHDLAVLSACPACHGPLDVGYSWEGDGFSDGPPGVSMWRYRDLLPHAPADADGPGMTPLVHAPRLSRALGVELHLKLESANPTHSFKDRLAASAVAAAQAFGVHTLCCSSTGNLGEALAARCAAAGLDAVVLSPLEDAAFLPATTYGARVFGVRGSFDDCRALERALEPLYPWGFLEGNLHPFAAEGAKTIAYELADQLAGGVPDAVVCPVASGTLFAKVAQGFDELCAHGLADGPRPRLYGAQAGGCPPLAAAWADDRPPSRVRPATLVRSLAIGDPMHGELAVGAARMSGGAILAVPEEEIGPSTVFLSEMTGVFADSAGGVAVGSLLELVRTGAVAQGERVVLVVTGTGLKPYGYETPVEVQEVDADVDRFLEALDAR
jgi:threonine synthase